MTSSKLSQVLNITLEEYIAKKGILSSLRQKSNDSAGNSHFKRSLRSEMDDDENEDSLVFEDRQGTVTDTEDTPISIIREVKQNVEGEQGEIINNKKPANVSIQLDSKRQCRTFITEEKKRGIKQLPSQQWRLRRENQVSKKPYGVPPLISVKTIFDRNTDQLIASLNENTKFQNVDSKNRATQQLHNNKRQWNNNRNWNRNRHNNFQNRNYQNNNRQASNRTSGLISSTQINQNDIRDLRTYLTTPPSMVYNHPTAGSGLWRPLMPLEQPRQLMTFANVLNQIGQAANIQNRTAFTDVIHNVMQNQQQQQLQQSLVPIMTAENLARMDSTELMPFAAQTMLNHIATIQQNFGPKYDMKLQKEIHSLQGKQMFYGSNGIVVSSDGIGVGDDRITPVSTDLSMNMRFS